MATIDYAKRAARGAALLDRKHVGWRAEVDPRTLQQSSMYGCVLGQVYGDYSAGLRALGLLKPDQFAHEMTDYGLRRVRDLGFQLGENRDGYENGNYYELTQAWVALLDADALVS